MSAPSTVNEFLAICLKSGIVSEAQTKPVVAEAPANPTAAAKTLIRTGAITKFQASQMLAGKYKGLLFDRLKMLDRIGAGGMGTVFLCEHLGLRKNVAVKMLPPAMAADVGTRERFFREARAAAALDHPNIVRVFDISSAGGVHYIVMEYVEGQDLQGILNRHGAIPHGRACNYAVQAALGLQHAHERGMIHRDIKPANLLVDGSGTVKILDMGLAYFPEDKSDNLTARYEKGAILGTADFMAPEQVMSSSDVDIRADIYSLGMTLYTLINGKPPFGGSSSQKLMGHQLVRPASLTTVGRQIPSKLSAIVDKMIAKNPNERFQTPGEVADALTPWIDAETVPVEAGRTESLTSTRHTRRRPAAAPRRLKAWHLGAAAGLAGIVVGVAIWLASGDKLYAPTAVAADPAPANPAPDPAPVPAVPAKEPGPGPKRKTPEPAAFVPFTVRVFDAEKCPEGTARVRNGDTGEAQQLLPPEWGANAWKPGTEARLRVETHNGSKALAMSLLAGDPSLQIMNKKDRPLAQLKARAGYRLEVEYATKGAGRNRVGGLDLRFGDYAKPGPVSASLPATGGRWRTCAVTFRSPVQAPFMMYVSHLAPANDDTLLIRSALLSEIAPPTRDPIDDDFRLAADADVRIISGSVASGGGELPIGYQGLNGDSTGEAEFRVAGAGDDKSLTFRSLPGGRGSASLHSPRFAADRTREYRVELEYRSGPEAVAQLKIDDGGGRSRWIADLPATGNVWTPVSVPVWPGSSTTAAKLEIHNTGSGKDNLLSLRRLAVRDFGPVVSPDTKPVVLLKPAAAAGLKIRRVGKQKVEKSGDLPDGFMLSQYDDGTTSELVGGEFEGSPAIRITNESGKPSAMFFTPPVPNPAEAEYEMRLEYLGSASPGAMAGFVKLFVKGVAGTRSVGELPHTNSAWRELRTRFRAPAAESFRLEVHASASGPDKPLLIRALEVRPYQPPAAGRWLTLARLDAADEKPFRLETAKGASPPARPNTPLPTGWNGDSWREGDRGSFTCEFYRGRQAFTLLNGAGGESVQMHTYQPITTLRKGETCVVKLVCFAEENAKGLIELRSGMDPERKLASAPLPPASGDWRTVELELTPDAEAPLYVYIQNRAAGLNTRLAVASLEVTVRRN